MDELAVFNCLEALLWMSISVAVFRKSRGTPATTRLGAVASLWFFLFGVSDLFEAYTGAWWRPWPLLVLKGACVTSLLVCGILYRKSLQQGTSQ
jgi:hypothetical protein